jgi:hypothetical protein
MRLFAVAPGNIWIHTHTHTDKHTHTDTHTHTHTHTHTQIHTHTHTHTQPLGAAQVSVGIKPFVPERHVHEDRAALIPGLERLSHAAQVVEEEGGGGGKPSPSMADGNGIDGISHIYVVEILKSHSFAHLCGRNSEKALFFTFKW